MRQSILAIVVCVLLGGFAVAGCGDDDEGSAASGGESGLDSTSESKAEYVAKADDVCNEQREKMRKSAGKFLEEKAPGADASGTEVQTFQQEFVEDVLAPGLQAEADELRELGAPEGEEAQVEAVIAAIETMATEVSEDPQRYMTAPGAFKEANRMARSYGIPACGTIA